MFQFFPKQRQDWMRVFEFPFRAFVVLAPISYWHFMRLYGHYANNVFGPRQYYFDCIGAGKHLTHQTVAGYLICFFVLAGFGLYHIAARHRASAFMDVLFAALSIVDLLIMQFSIFAVATS